MRTRVDNSNPLFYAGAGLALIALAIWTSELGRFSLPQRRGNGMTTFAGGALQLLALAPGCIGIGFLQHAALGSSRSRVLLQVLLVVGITMCIAAVCLAERT